MYKNMPCAKITVTGSDDIRYTPTVQVENYVQEWFLRPFGVLEQPTYAHFKEFLERRCFPKTRYNCKQLLQDASLGYYDPWAIVKKNHGVMSDDLFWIKFDGEELTWEDVKVR